MKKGNKNELTSEEEKSLKILATYHRCSNLIGIKFYFIFSSRLICNVKNCLFESIKV